MSQLDMDTGGGEAATTGTVDNMLHSQQVARASGPLAAGSRVGRADTRGSASARTGGGGEAANATDTLGSGRKGEVTSLLHREIDSAGDAESPTEGGEARGGSASAGSLDLTIPTDLQNSISSEQVQVFTQYAAAMDWSKDEAQAALDYQVQNGRAAQAVFERQLSQWEGTVRADPELGGKKLGTTVATANKAIHHFDPTGTVSALLKSSGQGSNPDVVRFLYKVGKALGEDRVPLAGDGQRSTRPLAERMYPNFTF